ncbi:MAG: HAD-IA family hydrolase [Dehalococcoidales bacterium]
MKYQAVIFDLFGTLAHNFSAQGYGDALVQMAAALSLPPEDFRRAWFASSRERNTGEWQSCEADVEHICCQFDMTPDEKQVELAVKARLDYIRHVMTPQSGAGETLAALKEQGHKTGLISDCTHEIPVVWPETIFAPLIDQAVFSCVVGMRKPDPQIYRLATQKLDVRPEDCLFVGDGGSQELAGAREVGMHPVLIRVDADSDESHLANREQWDGAAISSLPEVLDLVKETGG